MEKIEIKETDMKPNLVDQTVDIVRDGLQKYGQDKDVASFIKDTMEQRFSGTWHCVVGRSFGSRVSYELESFALLKVNGQHTVLIFNLFFALAIGVPSAVLYCLLLLIIVTNFKHFSSSFFILVIIRAVMSLINYAFVFLANRFGKLGLFLPIYLKLPQIVLAFLFFMVYYAFHVENLLSAFLLLNRLSAVLFPMKYEKLWRIGLPFVVVVTFLLPLPFTVPIFSLDMYIHVQSDNFTFTLDDHKTANELNSTEFAAWSALLFVAICLLLNLATLFAYKLHKNSHQQQQNKQNERKMTIYTVATFFGQLIIAIFMIFVYLTATNFVDEHNNRFSYAQAWFNITSEQNEILFFANFNQNPWVNDISTVVIPAWLLLWASSKVREIIGKKLKFTHRKSGHVMPIHQQQIITVTARTQLTNRIRH